MVQMKMESMEKAMKGMEIHETDTRKPSRVAL